MMTVLRTNRKLQIDANQLLNGMGLAVPNILRFGFMVMIVNFSLGLPGSSMGQLPAQYPPSVEPPHPGDHEASPHRLRSTVVTCPESVVAIAKRRRDYAIQLAERGATLSAKEELCEALWLICQAHDRSLQTSTHQSALRQAFQALAEADDLAPFTGMNSNGSELRRLLLSHSTQPPREILESLSAVDVLRRYLLVAENSLLEALRLEPIASEIVCSLGRVEDIAAQLSGGGSKISAAKKIMLFRVALTIDPNNVFAANELAVQLGRFGRWEEAEAVLGHLASKEAPKHVWSNLATIYARLGHVELAEKARATSSISATPNPSVRWVTQAVFSERADADLATDWAKPESPKRSLVTKGKSPLLWAKRLLAPAK